jgi:hypothetical protein
MLLSFAAASAQNPASHVEANTFVSPQNPAVRVEITRDIAYLGQVPFTIENIAGGLRYIFVRADASKHIQSMFIVQQEGFFPTSDDTYKYDITSPARLGRADYQHSVSMYNNDLEIRKAPGKEGDVTTKFLRAHGYTLESELVMSRFARPVGADRKHEILFFCYENLSAYGHKLSEFPDGSASPEKRLISRKVDNNCRQMFHVSD